jgi:hypothetical protein
VTACDDYHRVLKSSSISDAHCCKHSTVLTGKQDEFNMHMCQATPAAVLTSTVMYHPQDSPTPGQPLMLTSWPCSSRHTSSRQHAHTWHAGCCSHCCSEGAVLLNTQGRHTSSEQPCRLLQSAAVRAMFCSTSIAVETREPCCNMQLLLQLMLQLQPSWDHQSMATV